MFCPRSLNDFASILQVDAPLRHEACRCWRLLGLHSGRRCFTAEDGRGFSLGRSGLAVPYLSHPVRQRGLQSARGFRCRGTRDGTTRNARQVDTAAPPLRQGPLLEDESSSAPSDNRRREEMRHPGPPRDALSSSADSESRRWGALLRSRWQLRQRTRMVPPQDALLLQGPAHHREESQLLRHTRGGPFIRL